MSGDPDRLLDALADMYAGMVTAYVLVATVAVESGDTELIFDTLEDQRLDQTLGLLAYATQATAETVPHWDDLEEED